jgi:hypothetical protein
MICRLAIACALLISMTIVLPQRAKGQDAYVIEARVLDLVFPTNLPLGTHYIKLRMRFGDYPSQIVVWVYPGGQTEITRYSLVGMDDAGLWQLITNMIAQNPNVTDQESVAKLKIDISRTRVEYKAVERMLGELKSARISPFLGTGAAVHAHRYEFVFISGPESVQYTLMGGPFNRPQDQLLQWMLKFRIRAEELLKVAAPSQP